ncbi:MAG: hypothetical protein ABSH46_14510 [Bryobacteraceae bacterium]|jgi:hypothetical protein
MKRILGILRKDARHLWPQTLLFWTVLGAAAAIDPLQQSQDSGWMLYQLGQFLQPLACWLLVVSAIHGEKLVGHEQDWLTRPYSWKHLMAAKGLFLLVFINLPVLICQLATLAALGISPLVWLPALLWKQVFFTITYVLPAAAVAAVTRNLGQVLLAGILVYATFAAGLSLNQLIRGSWPVWGAVDWIRDCATALVAAAGTAAALFWQYSHRRTALARAVLAATAALTILVMTAPRWSGVFAIQRLFSRERISDSAVRISFDKSRASSRLSRWTTHADDPQGVWLEIPVRVDDVPPGAAVGIDQSSVRLKSARGIWRSGWLHFQTLHGLSKGVAWLTVYVDPSFYQASPDAPVQLDSTIDLTLSRHVRTMPVAPDRALVQEIGICIFANRARPPYVTRCFSPFQQVSFALALGKPSFPEATSADGPYAPIPVSAGFQALDGCSPGLGLPEPPANVLRDEFYIMTAKPVAYVRRAFRIRDLIMSRFRWRP